MLVEANRGHRGTPSATHNYQTSAYARSEVSVLRSTARHATGVGYQKTKRLRMVPGNIVLCTRSRGTSVTPNKLRNS